ncbi:MAG: glycosyltransferase family 8 protein [Elusimicrobiaceae bacterium]|nr:glycosyltransferase family 8 protein [Elusimicrobiaceae bacterium]
MQINVALAGDVNYFPYLAVTLTSILYNASPEDELTFYILCNQISSKHKQKLKALQSIKPHHIVFIDIDENLFKSFPAGGAHISNTTYARFQLADLLPEVDKIIYLDCDIIVTCSLANLFKTDIHAYALAGVEDVGYFYWRTVRKDMIFKDFFYINAGVLLINLAWWREHNTGIELAQYVNKNCSVIKCGDQDAINGLLHAHILPLGYQWNVQDSFYRLMPERAFNPNRELVEQAALNPFIIHYTSGKKPWNGGPFSKVAKRKDWYFYACRSPFRKISTYFMYFFIKYIFSKERSVYGVQFCLLGIPFYFRKYPN